MHLPAKREAQIAVHLAGLRQVRAALEAGQVDEARAYLIASVPFDKLRVTWR